ncbi:MAG: methyltransferase domain-containing protein, partial [Chloroflexi bacterium]|nr:methyltransferase domain-containing protein [Chloroflexota bacterium]
QKMTEEKDYIQKKFWTFFAPFYDIVVAPISKVRDTVVGFADAPAGARILDIATGTGKQAFAFARKGYNVTGVDLSEGMLRIATRKNKYENAKFKLADATNLPFEVNTFDVACVSFALHEMPLTVREKTLQEMVRVTRPEGTIVIVDYDLPKNRIGRFLTYHFVKLFEGEHYVKFMKDDLKATIKQARIAINGELSILLGGGRIIRGSIVANS